MSVENKVPAIRFKGFSGEWEEYSFSDISESLEYGLNAAATKYDGENKYIRITDVNEDTRAFDLGDITSPNADLSKADNYRLQLGDILFARTGASVGKTYIYKKQDGVVYFAGFLIRARVKKEVNTEFVFQSTLTEKYNKFIRLTSQRSGQPGVNALEYGSYKIFLAPSKEQTKIGNYFQQLDTLIAQHQQKHDKLLNLKKALLELMFPKQGATLPEIRFKGFSGEWEEKALGEIADVRDGTHDSPQYHPEGYPFVTSKNVKNGYINYDDVQYISKNDFDEINKRSKVDINDILMGMIGTIGNIALIRETADFAIKNVALIKDKKLANYLYVYYFLQSPITLKQLEDGVDGGTQKFISLSNVRHLLISLPDKIEQSKIGNLFQQLDTLITQHQSQLKKLNNIKQACLEKMFV